MPGGHPAHDDEPLDAPEVYEPATNPTPGLSFRILDLKIVDDSNDLSFARFAGDVSTAFKL